jgi:hypothetical protein
MENNKKLLLILTIGLASVYFILRPKQASAQPIQPLPTPPSPSPNSGGSAKEPPLISSLEITPNATNITSTSVKLLWKINQSTGFFLYPKYEYTITILNTNKSYKVTAQNSDGGFIDISGLTPSTQYSFEIYATDSNGNISSKSVVRLTTSKTATTTTDGASTNTNNTNTSTNTGTSGGPIGESTDNNKLDDNLLTPGGGKTSVTQTVSIMASQPTENSVNISWSASSPTAVKSFDVYQGNTLKTSLASSFNMIPISGLLPSTRYTFYVIANNNNGTTSSSGQISITTQAAISSGGGFVNDTTTTGTTGSYGGGGGKTISTNYDYDNMYKDPTSQFDNPINRDIEVLY